MGAPWATGDRPRWRNVIVYIWLCIFNVLSMYFDCIFLWRRPTIRRFFYVVYESDYCWNEKPVWYWWWWRILHLRYCSLGISLYLLLPVPQQSNSNCSFSFPGLLIVVLICQWRCKFAFSQNDAVLLMITWWRFLSSVRNRFTMFLDVNWNCFSVAKLVCLEIQKYFMWF